ncbi:MAG: hypothetical protein HKN39_02665 [Flavobacteriales bacterium]|nr:hypothetical protein [Flavobacteriales bacterium]
MKHKKPLIGIFVIALALTILGYVLDTDEPYPNWYDNVFEFCWINFFIFAVLCTIYILFDVFLRMIKKTG